MQRRAMLCGKKKTNCLNPAKSLTGINLRETSAAQWQEK